VTLTSCPAKNGSVNAGAAGKAVAGVRCWPCALPRIVIVTVSKTRSAGQFHPRVRSVPRSAALGRPPSVGNQDSREFNREGRWGTAPFPARVAGDGGWAGRERKLTWREREERVKCRTATEPNHEIVRDDT
jgi:hypothetical protein